MAEHSLKTLPRSFKHILNGEKTFEIRFNYRDYRLGDILVLQEYSTITQEFSGRWVRKKVTYITDYMQEEGYVVMALGDVVE